MTAAPAAMLALRTTDGAWLAVPSLLARLRDLAAAVEAADRAHAAAMTGLRAAIDAGRSPATDTDFAVYDRERARVELLAADLCADARALGLLDGGDDAEGADHD